MWVGVLKAKIPVGLIGAFAAAGFGLTVAQAWFASVATPNLPRMKWAFESDDGRCRRGYTEHPWTPLYNPLMQEKPKPGAVYQGMDWFGRRVVYADVYGWPYPAMATLFVYDTRQVSRVRVHAGLALPWTRDDNGTMEHIPRALPIVPIWGFWSNAGMYAAASLVGVIGFRRVNEVRRRGSGLCVGCGYPLGSTMASCPECGVGFKAEVPV